MTERLTLAVDIGGTKLAVALVDPAGAVVYKTTRLTPQCDTAEKLWAVVEDMMTGAIHRAGGVIRGVGIASPGPLNLAAGTTSPVNIACWRDFPLRDRVTAAARGVPVRIAGDALCVALGEHWRGAGHGAQFLLGMVVSTGVGGGLVLDGAPYLGRTGNAGHVGHVVVDPDGQPCACGGKGCVETVAAGPALVEWARANGWSAPPGAGGPELAAAATAGEAVATLAFHRGATAIAAMIASVAAVCDLDLVVIGGGVARSGPVLFEPLRTAVASYAGLGFLGGLRVVPAALGADAGLVGAAALLRDG